MPDSRVQDRLHQIRSAVRALSVHQHVTHSARVFGESGGVEDRSYPRGNVLLGESVLVQF